MPAAFAAAMDSASSSTVTRSPIEQPPLSVRILSQTPGFCSPGNGQLPRPAHRDAIDAQGRLADADRDALAVLAAGADAVVEFEIVADHRHPVQVGRPVADQHGTLDRRADFA